MNTEHSATEAARIVAGSGTAPEYYVTYVYKLRREAAEIVGRKSWEAEPR